MSAGKAAVIRPVFLNRHRTAAERGHPHVLGSVSVSAADDVSANWEGIRKTDHSERAVAADSGVASVPGGVAFGGRRCRLRRDCGRPNGRRYQSSGQALGTMSA